MSLGTRASSIVLGDLEDVDVDFGNHISDADLMRVIGSCKFYDERRNDDGAIIWAICEWPGGALGHFISSHIEPVSGKSDAWVCTYPNRSRQVRLASGLLSVEAWTPWT